MLVPDCFNSYQLRLEIYIYSIQLSVVQACRSKLNIANDAGCWQLGDVYYSAVLRIRTRSEFRQLPR
jgi:hypothetical protein